MVEKYNKFIDIHYKVIEDRNGVTEINLRDLLEKPWNDQPWLVESYNCIYLITNLKNGKVYVGQAKSFYRRFCDYNSFSHIVSIEWEDDRVLYRAIRKYGLEGFKVEVLKLNLEELNPDEIYFISYFRSYIRFENSNGYNMNRGGQNPDHLHSPEVMARSKATIAAEFDGDCCGYMHTPEAVEKACASRALLYNGDPYGQLHTPEARAKAYKVIAARYNGDPHGQIHTEDARFWNTHSLLIGNYKRRLEDMLKYGYQWTAFDYCHMLNLNLDRDLPRLFNHIWYSDYNELNPSQFKLIKDIYDYCREKWPEWTIKKLGEKNPITDKDLEICEEVWSKL